MTDTPALSRNAGRTLAAQLIDSIRSRIEQGVWRAGMRLPSIRELAQEQGVSRFTVVEAYDRLIAQGVIESRRGSGFYVKAAAVPVSQAVPAVEQNPELDVVWLLRSVLNHAPPEKSPGLGFLPPSYYDESLLASAMRAVTRQPSGQLLSIGVPEGFLPLREQLSLRLSELSIAAAPAQIVTTAGITQALDLIARELSHPGDTVLVEDPAWFLMFGRFARGGARVVGVPRLADGPDLDVLARLAAELKPRFFVITSFCHNPTGSMLSAAKAHQLLKLAEQHGFLIVEDDVYCDLVPPQQAAWRLASLDQLDRVIYCGGFSKALSPSLRVGFVAAAPNLARRITEQKILSAMNSPEINERLVHQVLTSGHFRKHTERLRLRLDAQRGKAQRALEKLGIRIPHSPLAGMFLWGDVGCDSHRLAARAQEQGLLMAPGALFSPGQRPSTMMRFNVTTALQPEILKFLQRECDRG